MTDWNMHCLSESFIQDFTKQHILAKSSCPHTHKHSSQLSLDSLHQQKRRQLSGLEAATQAESAWRKRCGTRYVLEMMGREKARQEEAFARFFLAGAELLARPAAAELDGPPLAEAEAEA